MPRTEIDPHHDHGAEGLPPCDSQEGFPFRGYHQVLDAILEASAARPDECVLELGIGTGVLAGRFLERGCRVIGLDSSDHRLTEARRKHPGLILHHADLGDPWPDFRTAIDHVAAAYSLHELTLGGKLLVVRRALDLLPRHGRVLVGDVAFASRSARVAAALCYGERWDVNEHYWAADETAEYFEELGVETTFQPLSPCSGLMTFRLS